MTIEIHELIIQARIDDDPAQTQMQRAGPSLPLQENARNDAMIEQIARRVLQRLRDEREGWR